MRCPIDGTELRMTERAGVEIDYCPDCRGVWLDRGELDKIIERSAQPAQSAPQPQRYEERGRDHTPRHEKTYYKKKKKNFLEDLFDF
ncbi:zf-TFIIB domain-containing protein [Leisingera aquaemixtae]|uniref:TFIIB-type zinc ribbon-containing protein n=1 Tax=Leisingera aquaemixtae TaxID=1396826 RepID=UPI001C96AD98|nr:zf-TFIIB domain-containing protein [Leisingera aquaemixtae]MBY6068798.1 zf-TFIIB domain-containing protein [Leisingera aquaemixtae]